MDAEGRKRACANMDSLQLAPTTAMVPVPSVATGVCSFSRQFSRKITNTQQSRVTLTPPLVAVAAVDVVDVVMALAALGPLATTVTATLALGELDRITYISTYLTNMIEASTRSRLVTVGAA
jgi:hypothetical protein